MIIIDSGFSQMKEIENTVKDELIKVEDTLGTSLKISYIMNTINTQTVNLRWYPKPFSYLEGDELRNFDKRLRSLMTLLQMTNKKN